MRILHLLPSLTGGGAERQMSYLVPELLRMGHDVDVAFVHQGPYVENLDLGVCGLHHLRAKGNYDPAILWQLLRLIKTTRPDVLHTWIMQMDVLGGIASYLTHTTWLLREPTSEVRYTGSWKDRLRLAVAKRVSAVVCNSRGGEAYWRRHYPEKPCRLIPNGLLLDEIEASPACSDADAGLPCGGKLIVYAGRLEPGKNSDHLLNAYSRIVSQHDAYAVLCGDGSLREALEKQIRDLGIADRVRIAGYLPVSRVWALMKRADVFTFASAFEGMPNVVMEAMACGSPLVVSDIPAHREILDERHALLVDPTDQSALADAIVNCLEDKKSAGERASAAKLKAAQWSVQSMARQYEKVYAEILSA